MDIKIRLETPEDYHEVEAMTRETFWQFWEDDRTICDEHLLVHKLRSADAFIPELDYVAELDGKIVGHIIYTKSWIVADDGKKYDTLTFGPLTALPEYQGKGIGKALMKHSFAKGKELGYRAVIIYGIPDYYPRVGFKRAAELGLTTADGSVFDAFLVYPLYEGALDGIRGKHDFDPVYMQLTQEEALEFDKRFPPKKPHIQVPIGVLLERLEPNAVNALKEKGFKTVDVLKSQSEREISSLPGMDAKGVETIRCLMKELKYPWGEK